MSLTSKQTAEVNTSTAAKAAQRARVASAAATTAAQNAAVAAQNAAGAAQVAAQNAAVIAANAAQSASGAAQTAASGVNKRVYTVRSWAAPHLESAADYTTTTFAPKVSSALRTTARQVRPVETKSSKRSSLLIWSVLGAAILAAVGAAAAMVRWRYREAIAADSEMADEDGLADSTGSQPASQTTEGTAPGTPAPSAGSETSADGRVRTTGS